MVSSSTSLLRVSRLLQYGRSVVQHVNLCQLCCSKSWLFLFASLAFHTSLHANDSIFPTTQPTLPSSPLPTENVQHCPEGPDTDCFGNPQPDVGSLSNLSQPSSQAGNPISVTTGNKYQLESDYQSPSSRLQFNRHYNSHLSDHNVGLGYGWRSSYHTRIVKLTTGGYTVTQSNGAELQFTEKSIDTNNNVVFRAVNPAYGFIRLENNHTLWTLNDDRVMTFSGSYLVRIDYPGHQYLTLRYKNGLLAAVTDQAQRTLQLEYTPVGNGLAQYSEKEYTEKPGFLQRLVLPDGNTIEYDYSDALNLARVRYADKTQKLFHYEDEQHTTKLTGITDRIGHRFATWRYDEHGRAVSSERADGVEQISLDYHITSDIPAAGYTVLTNSEGNESRYYWQSHGQSIQRLLMQTDGPGCHDCPAANMLYTYTDNEQLASATHKSGRQIRFIYDEQGRKTHHFLALPGKTEQLIKRWYYVGDTIKPSSVEQPSINADSLRQTVYEYNEDQLPVVITDRGYRPDNSAAGTFTPIERTIKLGYQSGRLSSIDGPRIDVEDISRFFYDELGRLKKMHLPSGVGIEVHGYDANGRATQIRIGQQQPVRLEYGLHGKVTKIVKQGQMVRYLYDAKGNLTGLVGPNGRSTTMRYDKANRLTQVSNRVGQVSRFVYDSESRTVKKSMLGLNGELVRSIGFVFDAAGRLQSSTERRKNPDNKNVVSSFNNYDYNAEDQLARLSNTATSSELNAEYDAFGQLLRIASNGVTREKHHYDAIGQRIATEDSRGNVTAYLKDDFGRVVLASTPDSGTEQFVYDNASNRIKKVAADGSVVHYEWDAANRLVSQRSTDDSISFAYHETNGRLARISNNTSTEEFDYDHNANLVEHRRNIDQSLLVTKYNYNAYSQITEKILPGGEQLRYHYYDAGEQKGRLRAITRYTSAGETPQTLIGEIDSDQSDMATGFLAFNGTRTQREYNGDGSVRAINVSNSMALQYQYDNNGNIAGINTDGMQYAYRYDQGRLVSARNAVGSFAYTYDSVGNRTQRVALMHNGEYEHTSYRYPEPGNGNRLLSEIHGELAEANAITYNSAGAATRGAVGFSYVYNAAQRPTQVHFNGELIAEYAYNGFGERVKKTRYTKQGSVSTYYYYDGTQLGGEISSDGMHTDYVYLHREPVALLKNNEAFAVHADHLNAPRKVSDASAVLLWSVEYLPFGKAVVSNKHFTLNLRYPGQYYDAETDTHYNYLRNYNPAQGRFSSSDPAGLRGGNNLYAYAGNNPLRYVDHLGLFHAPPNDATSDQLIEALQNMTAAERQQFVDEQLSEYDDREEFYRWAHEQIQRKPEATQSGWFEVAADVNELDALASAENSSIFPIHWFNLFSAETENFLQDAGRQLAVYNMNNFLTLLDGGDVGSVCSASTLERDLYMVELEQRELQAIMDQYRNSDPEAFQRIMDDINDAMNRRGMAAVLLPIGGDQLQMQIIKEQFTDKGIDFDISNINHRILLGQETVKAM